MREGAGEGQLPFPVLVDAPIGVFWKLGNLPLNVIRLSSTQRLRFYGELGTAACPHFEFTDLKRRGQQVGRELSNLSV